MTDDVQWFAGIDWASQTHQACLLDAGGEIIGERAFAHDGAGLAELCAWLLATTGAEPATIAVAIEVPHGPIVEMLLERGFQVYAINPKQLDRFRDRFTVAGAKDDRRDARVLGDSLRTDRHCFRHLAAEDAVVVELREWSRMTEELQQERNRLANRIREQLWRYYPQALAISDDLAANWFLELWAAAPTPGKAARLRESTVERLLKTHRIRRIAAAEVLRLLRQPALRVAPGTAEAASAHIRAVVARLKLVNRQIRDAHQRLDALCARLAGDDGEPRPGQEPEQRDVTILRSLPGVGRIVLATLLAEAAEPLRRRDYHALRTLSGVAPVTKRSGKRCIVVRRQACQLRLREAVYHWARVATRLDTLSRRRYAVLRQRGHSHGRALRSVADRLLAVACAMLARQTPFDPAYAVKRAAA
ncbi:MAG: IS110 family transposase [Alphaproteobacteria bacterium]|nr:IS110 family transposase [Alphaproteobacteria bacterium]